MKTHDDLYVLRANVHLQWIVEQIVNDVVPDDRLNNIRLEFRIAEELLVLGLVSSDLEESLLLSSLGRLSQGLALEG